MALVRTSRDATIVEILDAAQGNLVHTQMLPEPCTHVHVSWSQATHSSALVLATLKAPFKKTAAVHTVPSGSCYQGDFTFWAADSNSGVYTACEEQDSSLSATAVIALTAHSCVQVQLQVTPLCRTAVKAARQLSRHGRCPFQAAC